MHSLLNKILQGMYGYGLNPNIPERGFPGMVKPGNIDIYNRPLVKNPKGGTSTVYSMGVNFDGNEYLIPRITDDGKILSEKEAKEHFKKTGKHFGIFESPEASTQHAKYLHNQQKSFYNL
jgi:hypothetical protein